LRAAASSPNTIPLSPKSLANNFYKHSLSPSPIEFAVEDLFPRAEVKLAASNGYHNFTAHYLAFHMGISIVLACVIVAIVVDRLVWSELFEPNGIVAMEAVLIIIYENRGSDVHCVNKNESISDAALANAFINIRRDVDECYSGLGIEPQLFSITFQAESPCFEFQG
jgi:hypothetical protein